MGLTIIDQPSIANYQEELRNLQGYIDLILQQDAGYLSKLADYRLYTEGEQIVHLTEEQLEIMGQEENPDFNPVLNICETVVSTESDRLTVLGKRANYPESPALEVKINQLLADTWRLSRMDYVSAGLHFAGIRDGNAYLIVSWDKERSRPRFAMNLEYDGEEGVSIFYTDPANMDSAMYAFKIWDINKGIPGIRRPTKRLNVYWPGRIEYFITDGESGEWRPYIRPGSSVQVFESPFEDMRSYVCAAAPNMYRLNKEWRPVGIPVIHYPHKGYGMGTGVSGLQDLVPGLQDTINISHADLIAAGQLVGFPINWATGYTPPRNAEGDTLTMDIYPGALLWNSSPDGTFGQLSAGNLEQLVATLNAHIKNAASITKTPLTFFNLSGVIPAAATQEALQEGLIGKVEKAQSGLAEFYRQADIYALKLELVYGSQLDGFAITPFDIEDIDINTIWKSAILRSAKEEAEIAESHDRLGVPRDIIWGRIGYSEEQILIMKRAEQTKRALVFGELANVIKSREAGNSSATTRQIAGATADMIRGTVLEDGEGQENQNEQ